MTLETKMVFDRSERRFSITAVAFVFIFVVISFITIGLIAFYLLNQRALTTEILTQQQNRAREIAGQLENQLVSARQLVNTTAVLSSPIRDQTEIEDLITNLLVSSSADSIYGVGVWFEPFAFSEGQRLFGPYVH